MRTIEYDAFGPPSVLTPRDVEPPRVPAADEILVRVEAASVNPKDTFVRKGRFAALSGESFPKRTGYDYAGVVLVAGANSGRSAGDRVFGMIDGWNGATCAEQILVGSREHALAPAGASATDAAAMPLAALTALQALVREAGLEPGRRIAIVGASGGVGTFAVQIARDLGAHVTAVASGPNEALCRELGADAFVDYTTRSFLEGHERFDVIFDVFGSLTLERCRSGLAGSGVVVTTVPSPSNLADASAGATSSGARMRLVVVRPDTDDLTRLSAMVERGALRAVVERTYPLGQVARAHEHLERKHTRGKVVIEIG